MKLESLVGMSDFLKDIIKEDIIDKKQEIVNDDEIEIEWDDNF